VIKLSSDPNVRRDDGLKFVIQTFIFIPGLNLSEFTDLKLLQCSFFIQTLFESSHRTTVSCVADVSVTAIHNEQKILAVSETVTKIYLISILTPFFEAHSSPTMQYSTSLSCQNPPRLPLVFCYYIPFPSIRSIVKDKQRPA
jgi:hypothetical protein